MQGLWPLKTVPDPTSIKRAAVLATVDPQDLLDHPASTVVTVLPVSQANLVLRVIKDSRILRC